MRAKNYLDTENDANRWVTFEIKSVEITGPLVPDKTVPAKVRGDLMAQLKSSETAPEPPEQPWTNVSGRVPG